jgi:ribonuclease J
LRFHGRRKDDTEKFVQRCAESDLDVLLCEGTRVDAPPSITEYDVEGKIAEIVNNTKGLAICGYPIRDLDRLLSFYIAAKNTSRDLVIDMKQAYLLKLFNESENLRGKYPSPTDKNIKIYIQRGSWGLIDKDLNKFTEKQLLADYGTWQREFLDYPNAIDYRDIAKKQNQYMFFCSDFRLQDLIDIKPTEGATYIRSLTEPFNTEMEIKEEQVKNWFVHFGVIKRDQDWNQIHVSGHGDGDQIKHVVEDTKAKSLIPIHTVHDEYHKKWHTNVNSVNQHDLVKL